MGFLLDEEGGDPARRRGGRGDPRTGPHRTSEQRPPGAHGPQREDGRHPGRGAPGHQLPPYQGVRGLHHIRGGAGGPLHAIQQVLPLQHRIPGVPVGHLFLLQMAHQEERVPGVHRVQMRGGGHEGGVLEGRQRPVRPVAVPQLRLQQEQHELDPRGDEIMVLRVPQRLRCRPVGGLAVPHESHRGGVDRRADHVFRQQGQDQRPALQDEGQGGEPLRHLAGAPVGGHRGAVLHQLGRWQPGIPRRPVAVRRGMDRPGGCELHRAPQGAYHSVLRPCAAGDLRVQDNPWGKARREPLQEEGLRDRQA